MKIRVGSTAYSGALYRMRRAVQVVAAPNKNRPGAPTGSQHLPQAHFHAYQTVSALNINPTMIRNLS